MMKMNEMYSAMPGSPITYLAGDISAGQTTIAVADDTALPDAPNICTIGYGEHIETIRYGAKSNGVLQDVTRGIEGTPRAWQAGTEVARFFTAHDHNAIIHAIKTHQAESSSKHITESGTNENGSYIKFDDGTMICRGAPTISTFILNHTLEGDWIYPAAFTAGSDTVITGNSLLFTEGTRRGGAVEIHTRTPTTVKIRLRHPSTPYVAGDSVVVHMQAIGRWK